MCICIRCGCFSCKDSSEEEKKEEDCVDMTLAIFLPPAGIYKKEGCTAKFWANVVLTIAGYVPGSIHAAIVVSSK
ncbi:plasma membrane proteolipid 3-like [Durio zibethinus]|uniref:Plasma membrane proteolipid 3-like n=1 Tax=Durio zibethinus TaxID=66656 RepID=A0A6P6AYC6_DURZI|nr:plasma membrane proteolipid 3-like [Durio zibethinus]